MRIATKKVRRKSDGEVFTVNDGDYDVTIFEELDAPKAKKVAKPVPDKGGRRRVTK